MKQIDKTLFCSYFLYVRIKNIYPHREVKYYNTIKNIRENSFCDAFRDGYDVKL